MKTLRCTSGRPHDEISKSYDTGLCNRLMKWEILQEINRINNFEFEILVQEIQYPEIKQLIDLPNTKIFYENINDDPKLINLKFRTVYDIENDNSFLSKKIDKNLLCDILYDNKQLDENHYYSDFQFCTLEDLYQNTPEKLNNRHRKNIKLKNQELQNSIQNFTKDMIGIHVRRGRGVWYKENIDKVEQSIKNDYIKYREKEAADDFYQFEYIEDKIYFSVIDKILQINPSQKIYISYDGPDKLFDHWFNKYPKNLYRKKSYEFYFIENNIDIDIKKNKHYYNILDLFSLCYCGFIVKFPISTWSEFANYYNENTKSVTITDGLPKIVTEYKNYLKNNPIKIF